MVSASAKLPRQLIVGGPARFWRGSVGPARNNPTPSERPPTAFIRRDTADRPGRSQASNQGIGKLPGL